MNCQRCRAPLPELPPHKRNKAQLTKRLCAKCMAERMGLDPECSWTPELQNSACNCARCHVANHHGGIGLLPGFTNNETRILIALRAAKKAGLGGVLYDELVRITGVWNSMVVKFCRTSEAVHQQKEGRRVLNVLSDATEEYVDNWFCHLEEQRKRSWGQVAEEAGI